MPTLTARVKVNLARALDVDISEVVIPAEWADSMREMQHEPMALLEAAEQFRLIADVYEAHAAQL